MKPKKPKPSRTFTARGKYLARIQALQREHIRTSHNCGECTAYRRVLAELERP